MDCALLTTAEAPEGKVPEPAGLPVPILISGSARHNVVMRTKMLKKTAKSTWGAKRGPIASEKPNPCRGFGKTVYIVHNMR